MDAFRVSSFSPSCWIFWKTELPSSEIQTLRALIGGQPFLTRRALDVVKRSTMDFAENPQLKDTGGFHRLVAAGVMYQAGSNQTMFTCDLYRKYLRTRLAEA
jgi:hypothetical protein